MQNLKQFHDKSVFDPALKKKLLLFYTPKRTQNKTVYDYVDMNDGKLLFNCGTWNMSKMPYLSDSGGIKSILPLLENIKILLAIQNKRDLIGQKVSMQNMVD